MGFLEAVFDRARCWRKGEIDNFVLLCDYLCAMRIVRGLKNFIERLPSPVLTLGNFDGVHLGHQAPSP